MLFLTNTEVSRLHKAFVNGSSANIKLSKTQSHKIRQSGWILGGLLGLLLKTGLLLTENVFKPLAKSILIPLGLTAAASATGEIIHKKIFGSGVTTLTILNEEMNDIMKIVKSLKESGLLIKGVTIKNEAKEQKKKKKEFLGILLGTLSGSFLGNLSKGKGTIRADEGTFRTGEGTVRAGQEF